MSSLTSLTPLGGKLCLATMRIANVLSPLPYTGDIMWLSHSECILIVMYHMAFPYIHLMVTVRHVCWTSFPYTLDGWHMGHLLCILIFPKWVMCQFGYLLIILRHLLKYTHHTIWRRDLDAILDNFKSHLIPKEYHRVLAFVYWSYLDGFMTWFYSMSHPIMTPDAPERPHRPANCEVLEARDGHTEDVSTICRCIVEMGRSDIEAILFKEDTP